MVAVMDVPAKFVIRGRERRGEIIDTIEITTVCWKLSKVMSCLYDIDCVLWMG